MTTESMFEALRTGELAIMRESRVRGPQEVDIEHRSPRMVA